MIYTIVDWNRIYENNRSRQIDDLRWVSLPNKHDSFGFRSLMSRENGAALYGAWCLIVQVASKCSPRGSLQKNGVALTADTISFLTGCPSAIIAECLEVTQLPEISWLTSSDAQVKYERQSSDAQVKSERQSSDAQVKSERQSSDELLAGVMEGGNRRNEGKKEPPLPPTDFQLEEVCLAFDRHLKHDRKEPRDLVIQQIMSMNGKMDWVKFRSNHGAYCDHYAGHGWDFCKLSFLAWIRAGMPPPPPARSVSISNGISTVDKAQRRRHETNEGAKLMRNLR